MNVYRTENILYCAYLYVYYAEDKYTVAPLLYLCTYVHTKYIIICTGREFQICTYIFIFYDKPSFLSVCCSPAQA